jgi:membrane protein
MRMATDLHATPIYEEPPSRISASGWRAITWRVAKGVSRNNVSLVAAGLAMYALLSIFPALAAALSLYGLFVRPDHALAQIQSLSGMLPAEGRQVMGQQLQQLAAQATRTLSLSGGATLLIALWSTRTGMASLISAMNIAYGAQEKRSWLHQLVISLCFTGVLLLGILVLLLLAFVIPSILGALGTSTALAITAEGLRWVLMAAFSVLGLSLVYRFAPCRPEVAWRWVTWGSAIAAILWVLGSLLFTLYLRAFDSFQRTYGAVGSAVVLLLWFYLSSFFVMLGAEINAAIERQSAKESAHPRSLAQMNIQHDRTV